MKTCETLYPIITGCIYILQDLSITMRCYPKRLVAGAVCCSILYVILDHLMYPQDYQPVDEPLENMRFNQMQVRESNLFMALGPKPLKQPQPHENDSFFNILPHHHDEASYIKENRLQLRQLNQATTSQDDPRLLSIIQKYWIRDPSFKMYNLENPEYTDFSMGQSLVVDKILHGKTQGFFVECGALDGETRSNTLFFERERQWTGLLIEAGPINYRKVTEKNRKAYVSPACLSPKPYPNVMYFHRGKNRGRLIDNSEAYDWVQQQRMSLWLMEAQCFPIYSLLLAINRTHVDYLSLDIEGVELDVLRTIPFDKLNITVLTVEFAHDREGKQVMKDFMKEKGYTVVDEITRDDKLANDLVFLKDNQ